MTNEEILELAEHTCKVVANDLKMQVPKVRVVENDPDFTNMSAVYKFDGIGEIVICSKFVNELLEIDTAFQYVKNYPRNIKTLKQKFLFAVMHELGHIRQYTKFLKWYKMFNINRLFNGFLTPKAYRETKIESNADKVGVILYKIYSKRLLEKF